MANKQSSDAPSRILYVGGITLCWIDFSYDYGVYFCRQIWKKKISKLDRKLALFLNGCRMPT